MTLAIIAFMTFFAGGVWLLYLDRALIRRGLASYRWPSTNGTILGAHDNSFTIPAINRTSMGGALVKYKEIAYPYEYQVDGRAYQCSTYCFGGWADRTTAPAYLMGAKVRVYYDPKQPAVAVLRRGIQPGAVVGVILIGGAFLLLLLCFRN